MKYFILLLLSALNVYAIVSIAPVAIGEKAGFRGIVKGSADSKKGNTDSENYSGGIKLSYDDNRSYVMWGEFDFSYGEASGVKNTNEIYSHLRYIHSFKKELDWETFVQLQSNEFTQIAERFLTGGGLRLHSKQAPYGELYFGFGGFYEYINYSTTLDSQENNLRANFYIAYKKKLTKKSKIAYILYYQPKVNEISDYILSNALELTLPVYKNLSLNFAIMYDQDTNPATGVKKEDFAQHTGLLYKF